MNEEHIKAFTNRVTEENLSEDKTELLIENYLFSEYKHLRNEILDLTELEKPKLFERKKIGDRILSKIVGVVETFISGFGKV